MTNEESRILLERITAQLEAIKDILDRKETHSSSPRPSNNYCQHDFVLETAGAGPPMRYRCRFCGEVRDGRINIGINSNY